jgi:hypothetical protein
MFNEYDSFRLVKPLSDATIPVGTRGVVLMVFGGQPYQYLVEFPDGRGGNLGQPEMGVYTISEDCMLSVDNTSR